MKSVKIIALVAVLSSGLLLAGPGPAKASTDSGSADSAISCYPVCRDYAGTGKLLAVGRGYARVSGNLDYFTISGRGVVYITDNRGDSKVTTVGLGRQDRVSDTTIRYSGYGSITVAGSDVDITLRGYRLSLSARGEGSAKLCGHGWSVAKAADTMPESLK